MQIQKKKKKHIIGTPGASAALLFLLPFFDAMVLVFCAVEGRVVPHTSWICVKNR